MIVGLVVRVSDCNIGDTTSGLVGKEVAYCVKAQFMKI